MGRPVDRDHDIMPDAEYVPMVAARFRPVAPNRPAPWQRVARAVISRSPGCLAHAASELQGDRAMDRAKALARYSDLSSIALIRSRGEGQQLASKYALLVLRIHLPLKQFEQSLDIFGHGGVFAQ